MLVTEMVKTVTNISKLLPSLSVANIRDQHRCTSVWPRIDGPWMSASRAENVSRVYFQYVNFYLVSEVVALGHLVSICIQ